MFEENQPTQPVAQPAAAQPSTPQSLPQEPPDMFAQSDSTQSGLPNISGASSSEPYMFEEEPDQKPWFLHKKVIFIVLGALLLLIIIIFGVQFALTYFNAQTAQQAPQAPTQQQTTPEIQQPNQQSAQEAPQPPIGTEPSLEQQVPTEVQTIPPPINGAPAVSGTQQAAPSAGLDTDGDGLTDGEETALGTDLADTDTDKDGLTDREEVKVFFTDPRNPDTDSDGYVDGLEVKNGFNP